MTHFNERDESQYGGDYAAYMNASIALDFDPTYDPDDYDRESRHELILRRMREAGPTR